MHLASNGDPVVGDTAVKGMDRSASEQMSELVAQLREQGSQQSEHISADANQTIQIGRAHV